MNIYRIYEVMGFILEVYGFTASGYYLAKHNYFSACIFFVLSLILAFCVGEVIYVRGRKCQT